MPFPDSPGVFAESSPARYRPLERIAVSHAAEVWIAVQTAPIRRHVALKILKSAQPSQAEVARFHMECQALAAMEHPNVVRIDDVSVMGDGRPFAALELVKGVPLPDFCDARRLPVADRLSLFLSVCGAVLHVHQRGIVHRDLQPSHVLVQIFGDQHQPKLLGFRNARLIGTGQNLLSRPAGGTPPDTPTTGPGLPFQLDPADYDSRIDVHGLGALLYHLLAGAPPIPWPGDWAADKPGALPPIPAQPPPPPSERLAGTANLAALAMARSTDPRALIRQIRGELDRIVLQALAKELGARHPSVDALARDVRQCLARPASRMGLSRFFGRSRGRGVGG